MTLLVWNEQIPQHPTHSNVQGGDMRIPIFSGKVFGFFAVCLGTKIYSEKKRKPMGCFSEATQEIKKKGVWFKRTCFLIFKGEVQSRITIISKKRVKISLQIGAKMMKIG